MANHQSTSISAVPISSAAPAAVPTAPAAAPAADPNATAPAAAAAAPAAEPAAAPAAATPSPFDFKAFESEVKEKGKLSDESRKKITDQLTPIFGADAANGLIDNYFAGQTARATLTDQQVHQLAGGKDQYTDMVKFAASSYNDAEVKAYNDAINSGDSAKMQQAVTSLRSRFETEHGRTPNLVQGRPGTGGPKPFESQYQVQQAMSDKRYANDPAFRKEVADRVAVSPRHVVGF